MALGYVDVLCTALGGGVYEPGRAIGCSIVGSTGMHMRFLPDAAEVRLGPEPSGYTMPFPVPGSAAQMQSNMAATLNIDWIVDSAARPPISATRSTGGARGADARVLGACQRPLPPLHPRGGRTWAFIDVNAGPAQRPVDADRPPRRGPLRLRGLGLGRATATPPWATCPRRSGRRRRRLLQGAGTILASVLGAPVRESSRRRREPRERDDGGGGGRVFPDMASTGRVGDAAPGRSGPPDPELAGRYARLFPIPSRPRQACRRSGPRSRPSSMEPRHDERARDRDHRRPLHAARGVRRGAGAHTGAGLAGADAGAALARRAHDPRLRGAGLAG